MTSRKRKDCGVGLRLRELREIRKLSVGQVARRMEIDPSAVWHIEHGTYDMKISTIARYCDAIGARLSIRPEAQ